MNQSQKHDHWTQIQTEFKQSQLPIKQFCTERSIHYQTLYYWVKKLNSKEAKQHVQPIVFDQERLMSWCYYYLTVFALNSLRCSVKHKSNIGLQHYNDSHW